MLQSSVGHPLESSKLNFFYSNATEKVLNSSEQRQQNPVDIRLYWLVDRDPYNGLLYSLYNWVV